MKRIFVWVSYAVGALIAIFLVIGFSIHDSKPEGFNPEAADQMADSMLLALNYDDYKSINRIKWSYPRGHHYDWKKSIDSVEVSWEEFHVYLHTPTQKGKAFKNGQKIAGEESHEAVRTAWEYFANDSFWLVAPFKIKDPGTSRLVVDTDEGLGLLVTYTSGGVTPGDSYLWILDDQYRPKKWKMWVSKIPIGGLQFTWEGWIQLNDTWFAPLHDGPGFVNINIENLSVE